MECCSLLAARRWLRDSRWWTSRQPARRYCRAVDRIFASGSGFRGPEQTRARRPERRVTACVGGGRGALAPARAAVEDLGWGSRAAPAEVGVEQEPASQQWGERAWC